MRGRLRLTLAGIVVFGLSFLAPPASPKKAKNRPCVTGRFMVLGSRPLISNAATGGHADSIVLGESLISLSSGCPPVSVKLKKTKGGSTRVRANWPACSGVRGKVRLRAAINAACSYMWGTIKAKGAKRQKFDATLSACGDGMLDGRSGEVCDGNEGCAPAERCARTCDRCEPPFGGAGVCGNGEREGTEQCDGGDLGGKSCNDSPCGAFTSGAGAFLSCNEDCTVNCTTCEGGTSSTTTPPVTSTTVTTTTSTISPLCGNNVVNAGEQCDPPGSVTCPTPGSPGGALLACQVNCSCPSGTTTTTVSPLCGNGSVNPGEVCDPPGSLTCPDPGSPGGAFVACQSNCFCPGGGTTSTTLPTDHFKCYRTRQTNFPRFQKRRVDLRDQFGSTTQAVRKPLRLCNPADKDGGGIDDPTAHLMCYGFSQDSATFTQRDVLVRNQFGDQTLTVTQRESLCVPAEKDGVQSALGLNHFLCYRAHGRGFRTRNVSLADQFEIKDATVIKPVLLCNPVDKNGEGIPNPENHLTCYRIREAGGFLSFVPRDVEVMDQFAEQGLRAYRGTCRKVSVLCVPSLKNPGTATTTTTIVGTTTTTIGGSTTTTIGGSTTTTIGGSTTTTIGGSTTTTIGGSTTTTIGGGTTTTTTIPTGECSCCTNTDRLKFTSSPPVLGGGGCGTVTPSLCVAGSSDGAACTSDAGCPGGRCVGALDCGGLYFGGSGVGVPLPAAVPDMATAITKVQGCTGPGGSFQLAATTIADTGSSRTCTSGGESNPEYDNAAYNFKKGCLFGPPLPLPNPNSIATSVCIVNRVASSATGSGSCGGDTSVNLPLASDLYLLGDSLPRRCSGGPNPGGACINDTQCSPGGTCALDGGPTLIQPCPICNPDTLKCNGGPKNGLPCTPADSASIGVAYPTSHDCPPPGGIPFIGSLPIPFELTTGSSSKTATDTDGNGSQTLVFCGFCRNPIAPGAFRSPLTPCTSNSECTVAPFTVCQQRNDGAFGNGIARTITETGSPAAGGLTCEAKPATLAGVFCIPPSYNFTVDLAGDLPSPGAVSIPGTAALMATAGPPPSTTTTIPSGTTTSTTTPLPTTTSTTGPPSTTTSTTGPPGTTTSTTGPPGTTTTTTLPSGECSCCTGADQMKFTSTAPQIGSGGCGTLTPGVCVLGTAEGTACSSDATCPGGRCVGELDCGGLYFGGSNVGVPLPAAVPDMATLFTKVQNCSGPGGTFDIAATTIADTGSSRTCTAAGESSPEYDNAAYLNKKGCLFGPPLPLPNPASIATSVCLVNRVASSASGSGTCGGSADLNLPLFSDLYLLGDSLPRRCSGGPNPGGACVTDAQCSPGGTCALDGGPTLIQPCPICNPTTLKCNGGPKNGLPCVPGSSPEIGVAYPTSHDCPPPAGVPFIGSLPIPFFLTTGSQTKTATDTDGTGSQTRVFCGFCKNPVPPNAFRSPPTPCTSNSECTVAPFTQCGQRNDGAFGNGIAQTLTVQGSPVEGGLACEPRPTTLASAFCIPPSYNFTVDLAGDLASAGAVSLPGTAELVPRSGPPPTTTTTTPAGTTTTATTPQPTTTSTTAPPSTTTSTTLPPTTTTTTPVSSTTSTTIGPSCNCCTASPQLRFTTTTPLVGGGGCGTVRDDTGATGLALDCGGLYFGGAGVGVPIPSVVPDQGVSLLNIPSCDSGTGNFTLAATTIAETGSSRTCTSGNEVNPEYPGKPGCLFGPPLPIPNGSPGGTATSTCIINRVSSNATGSGNCSAGNSNVDLPLLSDLYLTGDLLPDRCSASAPNPGGSCFTNADCAPGTCDPDDGSTDPTKIQTCPICNPTTNRCNGGPNNGLTCVPGDSPSLGGGHPTSHDCPPPGGAFIGSLPIPFALTTGTSSKTATDTDGEGGQSLVFCGFCRNPVAPGAFRNPATPCTSDSICSGFAPFTKCRQRTDGAFGVGTARTITETGTPAASCLASGTPVASTLVSVFCIPPSYNGLVDTAADIPGPGAVALPGVAQLLP